MAGKGHENYQEVAGIKLPFSDAEVVQLALNMGAHNLQAEDKAELNAQTATGETAVKS